MEHRHENPVKVALQNNKISLYLEFFDEEGSFYISVSSKIDASKHREETTAEFDRGHRRRKDRVYL